MDEFAMGGSTENSAFGVTKNPHDQKRVAGGSSGGAAASVVSGMSLVAIGSDTGGSIRQPAAFCGCVGLKPTYGSVSRYGLMAMGSSLDVMGPLTKTVEDAETVFEIIKGNDPLDATSMSKDVYANKLSKVQKIGVSKSILENPALDENIKEDFKSQIKILKEAGLEIVDIDLPNLDYAIAVYYIVMFAESSTNLSRYDGVKFGSRVEGKDLAEMYFKTRGQKFGKEVKRRIMLGTYVLSSGYYDAYYNKAIKVRGLIQKDFEKAFEKVQVILMPTTPTPAFEIGKNSSDPLQMYLEDIFTVPANLAGIPAMSVPTSKVQMDGVVLPLSVQLLAPRYREANLFEIGKIIENGRR
jgi:aspartyl-tRNA(Asn)/glutamyl-tRNA(Gln) amidotransferase subunit A